MLTTDSICEVLPADVAPWNERASRLTSFPSSVPMQRASFWVPGEMKFASSSEPGARVKVVKKAQSVEGRP